MAELTKLTERQQKEEFLRKSDGVKDRRKNRLKIGVENRHRSMHKTNLDNGWKSPKFMIFGACLRDCANRDLDCPECYHFSKYEAIE